MQIFTWNLLDLIFVKDERGSVELAGRGKYTISSGAPTAAVEWVNANYSCSVKHPGIIRVGGTPFTVILCSSYVQELERTHLRVALANNIPDLSQVALIDVDTKKVYSWPEVLNKAVRCVLADEHSMSMYKTHDQYVCVTVSPYDIFVTFNEAALLTAKEHRSLGSIKVCLSWDVADPNYPLGMLAFMCGSQQVLGPEWLVSSSNLYSPDVAVAHDSFGETITVNTQSVDPRVQRISFVVTAYDATFAKMPSACVHVINAVSNEEIARLNLTNYRSASVLLIGELYLTDGVWAFKIVGEDQVKSLKEFYKMYGVI